MAEQHRRRHKAHLDQHIKDANGEYHYVGDWYAVSGGWRTLLPFSVWSLLAAGAVIGAGCAQFQGLRNTWYVILPYLLTIVLVFSLLWNGGRLVSGAGRLKAFDWEKVRERIAPLAGGLAVFAVLTGVTGGIYLMRNESAHYIAFYALLALAAVSAYCAGRAFKAQVWEKE